MGKIKIDYNDIEDRLGYILENEKIRISAESAYSKIKEIFTIKIKMLVRIEWIKSRFDELFEECELQFSSPKTERINDLTSEIVQDNLMREKYHRLYEMEEFTDELIKNDNFRELYKDDLPYMNKIYQKIIKSSTDKEKEINRLCEYISMEISDIDEYTFVINKDIFEILEYFFKIYWERIGDDTNEGNGSN
jgi:hypothetical protein